MCVPRHPDRIIAPGRKLQSEVGMRKLMEPKNNKKVAAEAKKSAALQFMENELGLESLMDHFGNISEEARAPEGGAR